MKLFSKEKPKENVLDPNSGKPVNLSSLKHHTSKQTKSINSNKSSSNPPNPSLNPIKEEQRPVRSGRTEEEIVEEIVSQLNRSDVSIEKIPELLLSTMTILGKMKDMDGPTKKDICIKVVVQLIDMYDVLGPLEEVFLPMLPFIIDTLIDVESGKIVINKNVTSSCNVLLQLCSNGCKC